MSAPKHGLNSVSSSGAPTNETGIGSVPQNWTVATLGELCNGPQGRIQTGPFGSILHKNEYQDQGTPIVNPVHLVKNRIDETDVPRIGNRAAERLKRYRLRQNDLLFARRGDIGRHGIVTKHEVGWFCGTGCFIVRVSDPRVDVDFLNEFASTDTVTKWLNKHAAGVIMPNLSNQVLERMPVVIPPLAEQRQIAAVLSAVQRAIERQERLIALTAELKKALMHKLFTEGTRGESVKQTEIGPVPQSWAVAPLDQFTESFQYGTSVKCGYDVKGSPVLRIPNVVGGHLDVSDLKFGKPKKNELETVRLRRADLLFVRTNGVRENAGRCSMYRGELGESCYFASYLIRARLRDGLMPEFVEEYTRTEIGVRLLAGRAARTADGKFNINTGTLETLLVPKPEIEEQKVIVNALASLDSKGRVHVATKGALDGLFRTLLHQLMTAQIRVQDLDLAALGCATNSAAADNGSTLAL